MNKNLTRIYGLLAIVSASSLVPLQANTALGATSVSPFTNETFDFNDPTVQTFFVVDDFSEKESFDRAFSEMKEKDFSSVEQEVASLQTIWDGVSADRSEGASFVAAALGNNFSLEATITFSLEKDVSPDAIVAGVLAANISPSELAQAIQKAPASQRAALQTSLFWALVKQGVSARQARSIAFGGE